MPYTPAAISFLTALARFEYLTASLAELAGIGTRRTVRDKLAPQLLEKKGGLIEKYNYKNVGAGSYESVYCLKQKGAEFIADYHGIILQKISYPKKHFRFNTDYFHRLAFIGYQIALRNTLDNLKGRLLSFDKYFGRKTIDEPHRTGRIAQTTIFYGNNQITPDGIAKYELNGKIWLVCIEIHMGDMTKRKRIAQQIEQYLGVMQQGAISSRYWVYRPPYIVNIFKDEKVMAKVMADVLALPMVKGSKLLNLFLFTTVEQVRDDMMCGWRLADGRAVNMFGLLNGVNK